MKPLAGVRVVDFSEGAQGPFAGSLLGDLGAEVVKVERPGGEFMRGYPPLRNGVAMAVLTISRSRTAVLELDIWQPADRDVARSLIGACDVLLQNWRLGTDAKLGVSYEDVLKINPRIVYVKASAYGLAGPLKDVGSMDPLGQAVSGMAGVSGKEDGPGERVRTPVLDFLSAMVACEAALIGLTQRDRTGESVFVETSQLSAALDAIGPEVALANLVDVHPAGARSRYYPWGAVCPTLDGQYVAIECVAAEQVARLAGCVGADSPDGDGTQIEARIAVTTSAELLERLSQAGIPHALVQRPYSLALFDRFPGAVLPAYDEIAGELRHPNSPWIFSGTPVQPGLPLGPLGRDNGLIPMIWPGEDGGGSHPPVPSIDVPS